MSRWKTALAAAAAGIALSFFAATAHAAPSTSPPPIGDACLVGRWVETQRMVAADVWLTGMFPAVGLRGFVITFNADGTETDDATGAQPLVGHFNGHEYKTYESGRMQFHVHADGATLTQTAAIGSLRPSWYIDGQQQQGGEAFLPATYTYRCSATTLHRELPALVSGYGPTVDDFIRAAPVAPAGSLVSPFSSSLATPASVLAAPVTLLVSAVVALAAVLLITFPSHLFNRTYEENHEVIRYWWEQHSPWLLRLRLRALAGSQRGLFDAVGYLLVVLCGGVLAALLDPQFGPNLRTVALFAGAVFALLAGALTGFGATAGYRVARHAVGPWHLHALPSGLLVAAACVLVSRLTSFQPGYLYGLIGGVVFARELGQREKGHVVAVTSLATLAVAVAAWLVWVPVSARSAADPTSFGWAVASNFLAAVFVSGMVGLLIGLVPLRFLPGERLASWHRGVWGAVFGLAALSVVEVMLRPQRSGAHVAAAPFLTTAALFVGFGVASVAFWSYFRFHKKRRAVTQAAEAGTLDV